MTQEGGGGEETGADRHMGRCVPPPRPLGGWEGVAAQG